MKDFSKNVKHIKKEHFGEFIKGLQNNYKVVAPKRVNNLVLFRELEANEVPDLSYLNSRQSPKEFFFPQTEKIVDFSGLDVIDKRVPMLEKNVVQKQILIGIRPCDVKSILILDKLFINEDYVDDYYKRLRDSTLIFGFGCNNPRTTCFCASFKSGPFSTDGSDVFITDLGNELLIEGISEKGNKLIEKLPDGNKEMLKKKEELEKHSNNSVESIKNIEEIPEKLRKLFENPIWEEISESCIGCGVCTYLCPTCHCFDIQDEIIGEKGRRVKNWDSCMFPIFTLHGSGHQPREHRFQRMRQRIMHKFNYYEENFKVIACSGCGRCITECPVNIDVRETLEKIKQL